MVFGIRASYHSSQLASASTRPTPICPCASCFNSSSAGGGQQQHPSDLEAARASPAAEARIPYGHHAPKPFSGLYDRTRLGLIAGLKRRRSVDTMASDMRPLRKGVQVVSVEDRGDGQSVLDDKF